MSTQQDQICSLAESIETSLLKDSVADGLGVEELAEAIRDAIQEHLDANKLKLAQLDEQPQQSKVSVLLKPSPNAKRMRELAGIPGRGNFV